MTIEDRARAVVLRHALDAADAAELLDMLGLGDNQPDPTPRVCEAPPARRRGTVLAVSAATEARLAQPPAPEPEPEPDPPAPAPKPRPKPEPKATRQPVERPCTDCGTPAVPQTRYRLDPEGYRARGVRMRAAKGLCWKCYRPPKGPKGRRPRSEPKPQQPAKHAAQDASDLDRWAAALVDANTRLAAANAELEELRERFTQASLLIEEMQVEVGRIVEMAEQLAAETQQAARAERGQTSGPEGE